MKTQGRVLFELSHCFETPLQPKTLDIIRATFGQLMDQAANELTRRGLDQDDCLLERWARIQRAGCGEEVEFIVQGLADRGALCKLAPRVGEGEAHSVGLGEIGITRLGVRVILEQGVPFGRRLPV